MTENDYIAEYIKEKHASLLGFDFAFWKMIRVVSNTIRDIVDIAKTVDPEDLKRLMEDEGVESDEEGEQE